MREHPVNLGELTEEIELQRRTLADDGAGGGVPTWTKYADVWAHIRPMSGGEREEAQRTEARSRYLVVVRHRSDILEKDRVKWGDRYLNVRFLRSRGPRPVYLEIECELGAPT